MEATRNCPNTSSIDRLPVLRGEGAQAYRPECTEGAWDECALLAGDCPSRCSCHMCIDIFPYRNRSIRQEAQRRPVLPPSRSLENFSSQFKNRRMYLHSHCHVNSFLESTSERSFEVRDTVADQIEMQAKHLFFGSYENFHHFVGRHSMLMLTPKT